MASATSAARNSNGATPAAQSEGGKKTKAQATGQKLFVRHLPPLITEEEVQTVLGEEWQTGNGKIDWAQFQQGKVSKSPFKEPRPSMYAVHIIKEDDVPIFKEFILRATWHDAKNTYNTSTFQVHAQDVSTRVPPIKHRLDPRQGTIDQDPEFQAFLHSLTQPKDTQSKETENGDPPASTNDEASKENKVSHLVKFIQEKKAAKAKDAAAAKSAKHSRQDSQGGKGKAGDDPKKKGKDGRADKPDKDKDKEKPVPKLLTKKAAAQEAAAEAAKQSAGKNTAAKASEEAVPKSRRANIAQAAKILQRDLGLSPGSAHSRARQNAAKAESSANPDTPALTANENEAGTAESKEPEVSKAAPTGPKAQGAEGSRRSRGKVKAAANITATSEPGRGKATDGPAKPTTGPIILLKKDTGKKEETPTVASLTATPVATSVTPVASAATAPTILPSGPKSAAGRGGAGKSSGPAQPKKSIAQVTPGAMRAFVKHANPSQGVTELLLKQAMETFGSVTFVEIDKRKGFAYVDFGDTEALRKAVAASPVAIAQGTVQVLERKDKKPSTPAPVQAPSSDKAAGDPQTATASTSADRPKRGNRGRGRRGGGAGGNAGTGTNGASNDAASSSAPAAG